MRGLVSEENFLFFVFFRLCLGNKTFLGAPSQLASSDDGLESNRETLVFRAEYLSSPRVGFV